mgnify:CR=1 FL=1
MPNPLKVLRGDKEEASTKIKEAESLAVQVREPKQRKKRKWRIQRLSLPVILVLSVISSLAVYQAHRRSLEVAELDAKLNYVFVEPIVDRLLLSNKKDKTLVEHREYITRIVRIAVHEAYRTEPKVPLEVLLGILKIESKFNPRAINLTSGATGMAQVLPATWSETLKRDGTIDWHWLELHDTETAIKAAVHIFSTYLKQTGDVDKALLRYGGFRNTDGSEYVLKAKSL